MTSESIFDRSHSVNPPTSIGGAAEAGTNSNKKRSDEMTLILELLEVQSKIKNNKAKIDQLENQLDPKQPIPQKEITKLKKDDQVLATKLNKLSSQFEQQGLSFQDTCSALSNKLQNIDFGYQIQVEVQKDPKGNTIPVLTGPEKKPIYSLDAAGNKIPVLDPALKSLLCDGLKNVGDSLSTLAGTPKNAKMSKEELTQLMSFLNSAQKNLKGSTDAKAAQKEITSLQKALVGAFGLPQKKTTAVGAAAPQEDPTKEDLQDMISKVIIGEFLSGVGDTLANFGTLLQASDSVVDHNTKLQSALQDIKGPPKLTSGALAAKKAIVNSQIAAISKVLASMKAQFPGQASQFAQLSEEVAQMKAARSPLQLSAMINVAGNTATTAAAMVSSDQQQVKQVTSTYQMALQMAGALLQAVSSAITGITKGIGN